MVVYRSEAERMVDQFIWHGGGWKILAALMLALVVVWLVSSIRGVRQKGK